MPQLRELVHAHQRDIDLDPPAADAPRKDAPRVPGKRTRVEQWLDPDRAVDAVPGVPGRQTLVPAFEPDEPGRLPGELRRALEAMSGVALDDVLVHHDSARPAHMAAAAYAYGNEIFLGPGHAHQLAHEAWHVVQQKQGRVAADWQTSGGLNLDPALEQEADTMAARALAYRGAPRTRAPRGTPAPRAVHQLNPLGQIEHIRDSCFIATIINTFAVTPTLRNLANPAANALGAGALGRLQNLLHRAINTVDAEQLVSAEWVAGLMTEMVGNAVIAAPVAQDVNEVMRSLVVALQNGHNDAGQAHGVRAYAGEIHWAAGRTIQQALTDPGALTPFARAHPANVLHVTRVGHAVDAPMSFVVNLLHGAQATYWLKSAVNRDVGSYDESHFISYVNRGTNAAPEWHENDDVGPRSRPIDDLDDIETDPVMIEARRKALAKRGIGDEQIQESSRLQAALAPAAIDVRGGAVMYIYERAGVALQAGPAGGVRTTANDPANQNHGDLALPYYQMMYAQRAQLDVDNKQALIQVLEHGTGWDAEIATLRSDIVQQLIDQTRSSAARLLHLEDGDLATPPGLETDGLTKLTPLEAEKQIIDAYRAMLSKVKQGGQKRTHQLGETEGSTLLSDVDALLERRTAKDIAALSDEQLMMLRGWDNVPLRVRGAHTTKRELSAKQREFNENLNELLDDPATQIELERAEVDRLLAIHYYLGADSATASSSKVRSGDDGIPDESDVSYGKELSLFSNDPDHSDLDDDPIDPDAQAETAQNKKRISVFAPATFGNHIPQDNDERAGRDNFTGLGFGNTTAFVMRGGRLVPRMLGPLLAPTPNTGGHRHSVGVLGDDDDRYAEDSGHGKLDAIVDEQEAIYQEYETRPKKARLQTDGHRRGMRHAFSNGVMFTEQSALRDGEEAEELEREREALARSMTGESPADRFVARYTSSREPSLSHAESLGVRTHLWRSLTRSVASVVNSQEVSVRDRSLQLFLNRSNCEGCARRLVLEAMRFWRNLATDNGLQDWRAARDTFRDAVRLEVGFSGNYFDSAPGKFRTISEALMDAGWTLLPLARHRSTPEFTRQSVTALSELQKLVAASKEPDQLRKQIVVSERLQRQIGDQPTLATLFGAPSKTTRRPKRHREESPEPEVEVSASTSASSSSAMDTLSTPRATPPLSALDEPSTSGMSLVDSHDVTIHTPSPSDMFTTDTRTTGEPSTTFLSLLGTSAFTTSMPSTTDMSTTDTRTTDDPSTTLLSLLGTRTFAMGTPATDDPSASLLSLLTSHDATPATTAPVDTSTMDTRTTDDPSTLPPLLDASMPAEDDPSTASASTPSTSSSTSTPAPPPAPLRDEFGLRRAALHKP